MNDLSTPDFKTLEQFIIEQQEMSGGATGAFSRLLRDLSVAAKVVNRDMRRAGLVDILGASGEVNVQGEVQQKMDALAHAEFVRALRRGGETCLIGSEEHAEAIPLDGDRPGEDGRYIVLLDPLDGSSNIDVNVSVGTIFSVYHLPEGAAPTLEAALQPGTEQVAAGYIVYGSSTILVYTTGNGVNGFTLEPSIGEFILSHPNIRTPETGTMYSVNEGNYNSFEDGLKRWIKWAQAEDKATARPYTTRYIGSFVSDFHRNLVKGGIYIYPASAKSPEGKLRLMYESNPMAFIVEQAGGMASNGRGRVMETQPTALHQRTPLYIGSKAMVEQVERFLAGEEG
ncbi:MAG: class 1 fructose-bisphosphatase [Rhodothermales bacterium]|nr:class 1 fructose-bisphosphatase [Rhodothermales bacterium]